MIITQESAGSAASRKDAKEYFYPEVAVGGYSRVDGTVEFYGRINALLEPEMVVLDFGAGRGAQLQEGSSTWRRQLQTLRGKCRRVIGVDVDDAILQNAGVDEAHILPTSGRIPLPDASVDMILCDWVFEHVPDPAPMVAEFERVLKKGGWVCARTPNRWGYIGIGTNLVPNRLHVKLLKYLQPGRKDIDVFPTRYKLNTRSQIDAAFSSVTWKKCVYGYFAEPAYFGSSKALWALALLVFRLTPSSFSPSWMMFIQRVR